MHPVTSKLLLLYSLLLLIFSSIAHTRSLVFRATIKPANAVGLMTPRNEVRASRSASSSSSIQLSWRLEKNGFVKKGAEICRFKTSRKASWLQRLDSEIHSLESKNRVEQQKLAEEIAQKSVALERLKIKHSKLLLEQVAREVMPVRDYERLKIDMRLADLEVKTHASRLLALEDRLKKLKEEGKLKVKNKREEKEYLEEQFKRYTMKAPFDGYVFFPKMKKMKRPARAQDNFDTGEEIVLISPDEKQVIEFYVPEYQIELVRKSKNLQVQSSDGRFAMPVKVSQVNEYPKRLTVFLGDDSVSGAQEQYFQVRADIVGELLEMGEGVDLEVHLNLDNSVSLQKGEKKGS